MATGTDPRGGATTVDTRGGGGTKVPEPTLSEEAVTALVVEVTGTGGGARFTCARETGSPAEEGVGAMLAG